MAKTFSDKLHKFRENSLNLVQNIEDFLLDYFILLHTVDNNAMHAIFINCSFSATFIVVSSVVIFPYISEYQHGMQSIYLKE